MESHRNLFEELEALESGMMEILDSRPRSLLGALVSDLSLSKLSRTSQSHAERLLSLCDDSQGALVQEARRLSGLDGGDCMALFYARLAEAREGASGEGGVGTGEEGMGTDALLTPLPAGGVHPLVASLVSAAESSVSAFTPDEVYGKYIDLWPLFEEWTKVL